MHSNNTIEKWEEKTINDVCIVERGGSPRPIKDFITTDGSGVNWIKIGDCSGKYVTNTAQKITEEGAKKSRYVKGGDFIISNSMSYGKPYILKIDGYIHDGWFVLRLNKNLVNTDYFYYLLSSNYIKEQYDTLATGAIVQNISSDLIKKVKFNLPPLSEQQRIVGILDEAFENIEKAKQNTLQNLNNAKELFENSLNDIFNNIENSCNFESLQNIYDVINGYSFKSQDFNCNNSIRVVKITNVGVKEFVEEDNYKLPKDFIDKYKNFVINANDIVIALTRTIISSGLKVAIVPKSFDKSLLNQRVACIKSTNKNCGKYLYYYLQTHNVYNYVKSKVNELMQPNLSINDLKNIPIPAVNYEIQNNIVSQLDELQEQTKKLEQIYTQKLQDLDGLKQSILQKAFNGEL